MRLLTLIQSPEVFQNECVGDDAVLLFYFLASYGKRVRVRDARDGARS